MWFRACHIYLTFKAHLMRSHKHFLSSFCNINRQILLTSVAIFRGVSHVAQLLHSIVCALMDSSEILMITDHNEENCRTSIFFKNCHSCLKKSYKVQLKLTIKSNLYFIETVNLFCHLIFSFTGDSSDAKTIFGHEGHHCLECLSFLCSVLPSCW